jgi:hypothetical protein
MRPGGVFKDNPFAFGGGLRNGGLTDEAMDLLRGVFSFDYMGAAEFEFGAVPKALQGLADADLAAFVIAIPLRDAGRPWGNKDEVPEDATASFYVICRRDEANDVSARIRELVAGGVRLKESTHIDRALFPKEEWDQDTRGWLELDNGFLFFVDKEMWEGAAALFGLEVVP